MALFASSYIFVPRWTVGITEIWLLSVKEVIGGTVYACAILGDELRMGIQTSLSRVTTQRFDFP